MNRRNWLVSFRILALLLALHVGVAKAAQQPGEEAARRRLSAVTNSFLSESEQAITQSGTLQAPIGLGHTWVEIIFSCAVLLFGLVLVGIQALLVIRKSITASAAFKLIGLTIVITAGLFVIPAGFSQNQMTPLMGLLGAVAGYLLGKDAPPQTAPEKHDAV